jgi:hypothetical protein
VIVTYWLILTYGWAMLGMFVGYLFDETFAGALFGLAVAGVVEIMQTDLFIGIAAALAG